MTELVLTRSVKLADLTDRTVLGRYGIAGDLSVGLDYGSSQRVTGLPYGAGFDGVYYTARHDPAFQERSVAICGGPGGSKLFVQMIGPIPDEVIDQAAHEFDLQVLRDLS